MEGTEKRISELEERKIEITTSENQKENNLQKKKKIYIYIYIYMNRGPETSNKIYNIHIIGERRKGWDQKSTWRNNSWNLPKFGKEKHTELRNSEFQKR